MASRLEELQDGEAIIFDNENDIVFDLAPGETYQWEVLLDGAAGPNRPRPP